MCPAGDRPVPGWAPEPLGVHDELEWPIMNSCLPTTALGRQEEGHLRLRT